MTRFLTFVFLLLGLTLSAQEETKASPVELTFYKEHINLGAVKRGDKRTFTYDFKNTGTEDVEIDIVSSCDCTTLDWTRGVIKPGEKARILATFDSTEKEASETVDVDVYLKNIDPRWDAGYLIVLDYTFELVQ